MYKYVAADSIFDGVLNIYLISIATSLLAAIVAFYCSSFLKDKSKSEKEIKQVLNDVDDGKEGDSYLNDTKIQNQLKEKNRKRFTSNESENTSDFEDNEVNKNALGTCNSSPNENSDIDYESDEVHVDGLVGKLKSKRVKDLEAQLTEDQLEEEKRIEREQLAAIFELLKKQEMELNMKEIDESELNAQLSLYR